MTHLVKKIKGWLLKIVLWLNRIKYKLLVFSVIIFIVIAGSSFALFEYWSSPTFCNSCHIMEPYYDSWKNSSHNFVRCVDCHYEPGVVNELKGKWLAIKTLAATLTGSYSPKPYAEISDRSCLRAGCHVKRLLEGKVTFSKKAVVFDHKPHLTEMKHGIKLACTSCHSQMVIGSHMLATKSTCFLCHFKGGTKKGLRDNPLGGCGICHKAPDKPIKIGDYTVSHQKFIGAGMECTHCHIDVTYGDGSATKDKCFHCHNQIEKIERFDETEFIHINHVTMHKVDCGRCHNEIEHKFNTQLVETQHQMCQSCHEQMHFPQSALYAGKGGKGITGNPDPMYVVGISCSGCHTVPKYESESAKIKGQTFLSGTLPCVSCHQGKYTQFVDTFNSNLSEMIAYIAKKLEHIKPKIELHKDIGLVKLFRNTEYNLDFLKNAKGIHNPFYSVDILKDCDANLSKIAKTIGGIEKKLVRPDTFQSNNCLSLCHSSMPMPETVSLVDEIEFSHKEHTGKDAPECIDCHPGEHPHRTNMNEDSCDVCH